MTREMAIQVLQTALTAPFIYGEYAEAIDMAIKALQVKTEGDSISKQEAIDCVRWGDSVTNVIDRIKALPSADRPTGEWIPVSERLPSDSGNYLITVADFRLGHIGEHTVTTADFYAKGEKWNSVAGVVAWMPLPKPYKGGEDK